MVYGQSVYIIYIELENGKKNVDILPVNRAVSNWNSLVVQDENSPILFEDDEKKMYRQPYMKFSYLGFQLSHPFQEAKIKFLSFSSQTFRFSFFL